MGLLNIFSAKDPQDYEQRGDLYLNAGDPGRAKLEYEAAMNKLEKKTPDDAELKSRLEKKIRQSRNLLACEHKKSADDLMTAGYPEDASELYDLALELTTDPELAGELKKCLQNIESCAAEEKKGPVDVIAPAEKFIAPAPWEAEDEYFNVLCSILPEDVKKAYRGYGEAFKKGYIALNQGQFEKAAKQLSLAMEENASPESLIPLELATAYLNLEKYEEARLLLEEFVKSHPAVLPGYQLLCEIYWETDAFDQAAHLLSLIPEELKESVAVYLLRGETFFRANKHPQAKSVYLDFLQSYGWHEPIARALARTFEALGETENARQLYGEILSQCRTCGSQIDPFVKRKYADLSLAAGLYSTKILELYFSLIQQDPQHTAEYHQKISRIYSALGNSAEARRFKSMANKVDDKE